MKILFLCKSNIFRSQIAEAFFNKYSKKHNSKSAGFIKPDKNNHEFIIRAMSEKGIDISNKYSKELTKEMIDSADKIILMNDDLLSFAGNIPKNKLEIWDIEDTNASEEDEHKYPEIVAKRDKIEIRVKDLIKRLK